MARIIGIDLGVHSVKVAEMQVGFRSVSLASLQMFEVEPGVEDMESRSLSALAALGDTGEHDGISVGVSGDRLLFRLLDIPALDPRRLHAVVGNELADDVPWELEEFLYDEQRLPSPSNKVLSVAARVDHVERLLLRLNALGIQVRHLSVSPASYAELGRRVEGPELLAVVDIGHARTNVCVARDGRPLLVRTLSQGGHTITESLRTTFQLGYQEAQQLKESCGLLAVDVGQLGGEQQRIAKVTGAAVSPLVRQLRQTFDRCRTVIGHRPDRVVLCGGTSLLSGIEDYLSSELALPTVRLGLASHPELQDAGLSDEGAAVGALSIGLALEHGRHSSLELRQGRFAFRVDRSVFRDKLLTVAGSTVAILLFAVLSAYASLHALEAERTGLVTQLRSESQRVFGKSYEVPSRVISLLNRTKRRGSGGITDKTAVDVLDLLAAQLPKGDGAAIDVTRLDIQTGKTYLKGTADSGSTVGKMVEVLKRHACVKQVSSGKISTVAEGKKQFTMDLTTSCF